MKRIKLCGGLVLGLLSTSVMAQVRVVGEVEHGLFQRPAGTYEEGQTVLTAKQESIEATEVIPARLGSKFGVRYQLEGKRKGDEPLTLLYLTPGVTTPDGQRHDKFVVQQPLTEGAAEDVMAFEFTERHEVVPGQWRFLVFQGDRLLVEQSFEVR